MSTNHHNRGVTQRQPSLYPERRMTFETRGRRPETGEREQEAFETGDQKPEPGVPEQETGKPGRRMRGRRMRTPFAVPRACAQQRPVSTESGFRSPVSRLEGSPASGFALSPFAGLPIRSIRGQLGDRVYKTYGDKVIVTRVPCFDGYVPTAAQRKRREKLREATAYAQAVYADPAAKAIYVAAAKQLGRQPFRLAVADFLRGRPGVKLDLAAKSPAKVSERTSPAETRSMPEPSRLRLVHPHSRSNRMPPPAGRRTGAAGQGQAGNMQRKAANLCTSEKLVPGVGVEPTRLSSVDFESTASANSATRARQASKATFARGGVHAKFSGGFFERCSASGRLSPRWLPVLFGKFIVCSSSRQGRRAQPGALTVFGCHLVAARVGGEMNLG
jgi:hypothetical protein